MACCWVDVTKLSLAGTYAGKAIRFPVKQKSIPKANKTGLKDINPVEAKLIFKFYFNFL